QAVPIVLEARNLVSLALADSVVLNSAPEGLLEDTHGFGDILTRPHKNDILYDVPMASWIWTIGEPGKFIFPGVKLSVAGLNRTVSSFPVKVLPLPEELLSSGAVGHFNLSVEWNDTEYRVGDIVSIRVKAEGSGNLNVLNLPVPELSSASLVSQGSTSSFVPGFDGYQGWRIERYDFQIEKTGSLQLNVPDWKWLEPEGSGRIRKQSTETEYLYSVEALEDKGKIDADMLLGSDLFRYRRADFHWRNQYWFLLAFPGFITLLTIFIVRRPGARGLAAMLVLPLLFSASNISVQDAGRASAAAEMAMAGDWDSARAGYHELFENVGEIPGLLNDIAVVEMVAGNPDKAVSMIRRALVLRPGSARLSETQSYIEERFGLSDQESVSMKLPPSLFFIIWLVFINAFFASLTWLMFRRNAL
ncbi:MAG: BatD family protein, partial [Spirochaetaceae bacterium]|nr:BatD family protein [Spirochaetaceae bacterium]